MADYPFQFLYTELIGIRTQDGFPSSEAHYSNAVDVGMLLEAFERVDDYGSVVNVHKLLGDFLPHTVASSSRYN